MQTYENPDTTDEYWTWSPGSFTHRYGQEFKYDANGNITNQTRLDDSGTSAGLIDDLQYHYYHGTNRLEYVANSGTVDPTDHPQVPDQNPENYLYDRSGNLVQDCSELLETIIWNHFGKATMIRKGLVSDNIEIHMGYDAQQQRIKKQVIEKSIEIPIELPEGTDCFPNDPQHEHEVTDTLPTTWYVRDATGNVLAVYEQEDDTLRWKEQHLFGSSRLGMVQPDVVVSPLPYQKIVPHFIRNKEQPYGARRYELSNHLGNVMAVLSDRKMPRDIGSSVTYDAVVHSARPAHPLPRFTLSKVPQTFGFSALDRASKLHCVNPFGSLMTERTFSAGGYRYGFNTQEKVDEVKGTGNHYSAEFWEYDPRVVHRWNIDPRPNPSMSPYAILGGNPIWNTDWAGDTAYVFSGDGIFTGDIQYGDEAPYGLILDYKQSGENIRFDFVDPAYVNFLRTPDQIGGVPTEDNEFLLDRVEILGKFDIKRELENANVFGPNPGALSGLLYGSRGFNAPLDFSAKASLLDRRSTLFLIENNQSLYIAHDMRNYGNFLWGATTQSWGVPGIIARMGAHIDAWLDPKHKGFDSADDQKSIILGREYAKQQGWRRRSF